MQQPLRERFHQNLPARKSSDPEYVSELVDAVLRSAREAAASDVHLQPTAEHLEMKWRIDGVLQPVAEFPLELATKVVARLKVLAELLTYRTDIPQEGRLCVAEDNVETRISTFPTLFGEKVVARLFVGSGKFRRLDELGLESDVLAQLQRLLEQTGGVILLTGPAGSGKTTTIYAALREIVDKTGGSRSLVTLEDPIEVVVPGVAQSQVNPAVDFNMATGLRSQLRQDPEVLMVGEIRDRETAETVFQACLTGHLVVTTFHAGSAAAAISRLCDMGIEPYLIRSGLLAVLCQRLLRKLCHCAIVSNEVDARMGLNVEQVRQPVGCDDCGGTGYSGRMLLTEMLIPDEAELGRAILDRSDARQLHQRAVEGGMVEQWERARQAVERGETSPAEVFRVLGTRNSD
ncbi:MAG: type II/IV secretion system protein [Planctomycetaceae bacterium]|jgi:general secretion pathway protein E|nr:type II/IV secretion system protein [Planctomycetaceae bacterium]MBT6157646.1 type II/IV secretion system protein [Planctomycetaceae bacterium]MBT6483586.1 type II/IV secretion system protein [Planctomycetaceae bacterium]MBT6493095.1 type II/IV secretion system protein [Planctomycetaceae bacterium]